MDNSKKTYKITRENLIEFCAAACRKGGFSPEDARITAEVLTDTDMAGTHSHGTKNLHLYLKKGDAGGINKNARPKIVAEGPAWGIMDGEAGMGVVVAQKAMSLAMEKAARTGIAMVTVRNSTHFGAAGYYSAMAARRGMFGLAMGNTEPNMGIPGGRGREIGNSPISYAFPQKNGGPLCLDMALSAAAALKIVQAEKDGKSIPDSWVVDKDGFPTTRPSDFTDGGALAPMAGHKGYGLSILVEILTGLLSGGAIRHEMTSWCWDLPSTNKVSHCFIAIHLASFMPPDAFGDRLEEYVAGLKNSPRREGVDRLLVPGEIENENFKRGALEGLSLPADVAESLVELSERFGLPIEWM